ncbi:MFS transporter [Terrimonas pollutisoli]|uniref:MFS transporter n=1 Tax=Terrimonas pollutisoli TaxID=3034147 RepID=UPI0023EB0447|nr:MFS transporter [Terrimonas sp. H1YJ31]
MKLSLVSVFRNSQRLITPLTGSFTKTKNDMDITAPTYSKQQIRIAVSAFFFCQGLCFASWASRIPDIKTSLQLSDAALGSILLMLPAGQLTAMPFSGRLITHYGSKKVLRICLVLYAICLTNLALATQPWHLALGLFLFGICGNMCNISVNTQAIRAEKLYGRPIMTSFHGVWSTAGFAGAAIGLLMMSQHITPYIHFWIITALVFITIVISQRYLQWGKAANPPEKKSFFSKPDGMLMQFGVIGFFSMASEGAMFDWSGVYFQDVVHAPKSLIALGYMCFMIAMASGRFVGDRLISKYGRQTMLKISGVLISSGLFLSVILPHIITATLGFLIVGFGVSSIVPMVYSAAGKQSKIPPGMALAAVSSISFLGFLMGPPLIGYIAQLFSLRYSFAVIGLLGISISLMVSKIKALK